MKTAIITGATGFIGQALINELSVNSYVIYAICRDEKKAQELQEMKNVKTIICDIANINLIIDKIDHPQIDVFFHLAWDGSSGDVRGNYEKQLANVNNTCKAVIVANKLNCKCFIYAGSVMEYESTAYIPKPYSKPSLGYIYSTAKLTAHYMAKSIAVNLDLDFRVATISNAYGAGEKSQRLINTTVRKMLKKQKTSFTFAEQMYDFIYITDVAVAFRKIFEQGKPFGNYYIGNKTVRPLKDYLTELGSYFNVENLGLGEIPFNGVSINYNEINTLSLYQDTDFKCSVSFRDGIKKLADWIIINE